MKASTETQIADGIYISFDGERFCILETNEYDVSTYLTIAEAAALKEYLAAHLEV